MAALPTKKLLSFFLFEPRFCGVGLLAATLVFSRAANLRAELYIGALRPSDNVRNLENAIGFTHLTTDKL